MAPKRTVDVIDLTMDNEDVTYVVIAIQSKAKKPKKAKEETVTQKEKPRLMEILADFDKQIKPKKVNKVTKKKKDTENPEKFAKERINDTIENFREKWEIGDGIEATYESSKECEKKLPVKLFDKWAVDAVKYWCENAIRSKPSETKKPAKVEKHPLYADFQDAVFTALDETWSEFEGLENLTGKILFGVMEPHISTFAEEAKEAFNEACEEIEF